MSDSPKAPVTILNSVSAADRARLEAMHSRIVALGAENHGVDATRELTGFVYEILQLPITHKAIAADNDKRLDHSLEIAIHRSTAKAIADVIHICAGGSTDRSDCRLEELDGRTVPNLVFAIEWHLEEADRLEEEERQWHEAARGNAKGDTVSH